MEISRRSLVLGLGALATGVASPGWASTDYPSRPVRIIVPFPAGSTPDLAARHLAKVLGDGWKQPVIVDNKPGADTLIGTMEAIRAKPDGHTVLINISQVLTNPLLRRSPPYDFAADLKPATAVSTASLFLTVSTSSGATALKHFVDLAKQRRVTFGTLGPGWSGNLAMLALERSAGFELSRIPYKGSNEVIQALMRGDLDAGLLPYGTVQQAGDKVRVIATMGRERFARLPAVATFEEAGAPGLSRPNWLGFFMPAGTPSDIVQKFSRDVNAALRTEALVQYLESAAFAPFISTPEEFSAFVSDDYKFYASIIRAANIKLD